MNKWNDSKGQKRAEQVSNRDTSKHRKKGCRGMKVSLKERVVNDSGFDTGVG